MTNTLALLTCWSVRRVSSVSSLCTRLKVKIDRSIDWLAERRMRRGQSTVRTLCVRWRWSHRSTTVSDVVRCASGHSSQHAVSASAAGMSRRVMTMQQPVTAADGTPPSLQRPGQWCSLLIVFL